MKETCFYYVATFFNTTTGEYYAQSSYLRYNADILKSIDILKYEARLRFEGTLINLELFQDYETAQEAKAEIREKYNIQNNF